MPDTLTAPALPATLRGYYEFIRLRLGIPTPLDQGVDGARAGDEPAWYREPSNLKIRSAVTSACQLVNRHVHLADAGSIRSLPIAAQTASGPCQVDLSSVPGLADRSLNSIRRTWWNDGSTSVRLDPVNLDALDFTESGVWLNDAPGTPRRFAIEGYTLYLDPSPASAGTFQFMGGCGVLPPADENDGYDQIPTDYDPCINFIALVELAKMYPNDKEMLSRAQMFAPDAAAGLERLAAWFAGGSNEEAQYGMVFNARSLRRYSRGWR